MKNKKVLIILGHPDKNSFCGALADAYESGVRESGAEVNRINLGDIKFDPILHYGYKTRQELEPDLKKAQEMILWSNHIVIIYPTWWASIPALLKGFIDRVFHPGFAFKPHKTGLFWDKLLIGKSSRIITTMDAPLFYYKLFYRSSGTHLLKNATLNYCGIKPVKCTFFSRVKFSNDKKKGEWILKVKKLGEECK